MANLQDLINLAKADGGKFFVMDEGGEARLVIMSVEDYELLMLGKLQRRLKEQVQDVEKVNREILNAQLQEGRPAPSPAAEPPRPPRGPGIVESRKGIFPPDLRAEVIDPSFDFEASNTEIDDL